MNKYKFTSKGRTFTRVSKTAAKKAFINGFTIALCPSNLRPGAPWHPETITNREIIGAENPATGFDVLLSSFEYFNCTNTETGRYAEFFIESENNEGE